jgi:cellulose synthase/poly-beta-1,6-N-acetylglucosamine synthase-like glycosyltransferase
MTLLLAVLFWVAASVLVYAYFGYPLLLALLARQRAAVAAGNAPTVSMIIAAYNEAGCIEEKVKNALEHNYPKDRLEVIVVSDGSTDETAKLVKEIGDPRVRLFVQAQRQGKNLALNVGAREAKGDILVFTDANAMLTRSALARLVIPFSDPKVALVSGQGLYAAKPGSATEGASNTYVRYEQFLKEREAALGMVAAADGALYAMRHASFQPLAAKEVHDLAHPLQVALARKLCAFVPDAVTIEPPTESGWQEFDRHVRIITQGLRVYGTYMPRLLSAGCWKEAWMLTSHRLLRWISAFFLVTVLVTSLLLALNAPFFGVLFVLQLFFYGAAIAGAALEGQVRTPFLSIPFLFCLVSVAGLQALVEVLRGRSHETWVSTSSSGDDSR